MNVSVRQTCRISNEPLRTIFSLGNFYVSDFIQDTSLDYSERIAPLEICISDYGLVQLRHTVNPDLMYKQYWYRSNTNKTMPLQLKDVVDKLLSYIQPTSKSVWVDIGANDGTMLSFVPKSIYRLGYEPALNDYVREATQHASEMINDYFSADVYPKIEKAQYITSTAMFYDIEDPHKFVSDVYQIMDDNGIWAIQINYLPLMLKQLIFDNICHEHLEYYDLITLKKLLNGHGLEIVDCELNDTNVGSIRVYVRKFIADEIKFATAAVRYICKMRVESLLAYEEKLNAECPMEKQLLNFFDQITELKNSVCKFIENAVENKKTVGGYGASTKGNTLLQWFNLNSKSILGIAERQSSKIGLYTIGSNIPIISEEAMRKIHPDYILVLPWTFIQEFKQREKDYLETGGKFIIPGPKFEIIN